MEIVPKVASVVRDRQMWLSTMASVTAQPRSRTMLWSGIKAMLLEPEARATKSACPLLKLATFRGARNDDNVADVHGIEGDHDAETMTPAEAAARLNAAGIEAMVYTTASHLTETFKEGKQKSFGGPRWRVLAPLSGRYAPADRAAFVDAINGVLGGALASESWTLSQPMYYGRVDGIPYEVHETFGEFLDLAPLDLVGIEPIGNPGKARQDRAAVAAADMPQIIADKHLPSLDAIALDEMARGYLDGSRSVEDRSLACTQTAAGLYRALGPNGDGQPQDAVVLSILWSNPHLGEAARSKRGDNDDAALEFLWTQVCAKQRHHAREACTVDDFDDLSLLPEVAPPLPDFTRKNGRVLGTLPNIVMALSAPHVCGWRIGRDLFRDDVMIAPAGTDAWRPLVDDDITAMRERLMRDTVGGFTKLAKDEARDAISLVARLNEFDTAVRWLAALHWDGVERVNHFCSRYLGAEGNAYTRAVGRYLWSALAGRVMQGGVKADMVPVLIGAQGLRKSSAVAAISPSPDFFKEIALDALNDADQSRRIRGLLVGELAELRGLRSREQEAIKAFIVRTHEHWTPKYKEFEHQFARRCVFIGTSNVDAILDDATGNRRWLPLRVGMCDPDLIVADREQLWAEGAVLFARGGVDFRGAEQLAEAEHDGFKVEDPWTQRIADWLAAEPEDLDAQPGPRYTRPVRVPQILSEALHVPVDRHNATTMRRVGSILTTLGYRLTKRIVDGRQIRAWVLAGR